MNETVEWLRAELQKRLGPWTGVDDKGKPEMKEQLYIPIMLMPNQAAELLVLVELGMQHTPEALGRRMSEGAEKRTTSTGEIVE